MDNNKYSLFYLFLFLIRGCIFIFFISIVFPYFVFNDEKLNITKYLSEELNNVTTAMIVVFLLISYTTGYITSGVITIISQKMKYKKNFQKYESERIEKVRDCAPKNYPNIDRFNPLRLMSWNISITNTTP